MLHPDLTRINLFRPACPMLNNADNPKESTMQAVSTEKLMQDLHIVVGDAEELLKATAGQTGERVQQARARAEESLRDARARLEAAAGDIGMAAREAARNVNREVHQNPWPAIGIAAGAALLVGVIIGRK